MLLILIFHVPLQSLYLINSFYLNYWQLVFMYIVLLLGRKTIWYLISIYSSISICVSIEERPDQFSDTST